MVVAIVDGSSAMCGIMGHSSEHEILIKGQVAIYDDIRQRKGGAGGFVWAVKAKM